MRASTGLRAHFCARVGRLAIDAEIDTGGGTLVLIGPNGAGKTSLLSLVLGVLPADRARLEVSDAVLVDTTRGVETPVERRRIAYVPQDYGLFPHLSVRENVAFALRSASRRRRRDEDERVDAALASLGVSALAERRPETLSGGEKQRVALARALSVEPRALLLDEPLAALDVNSQREVRAFLARTLRGLALPTVVVSHDPADARALGQRIAVLESGKISQAGAWSELVESPRSRFIEEFVSARDGATTEAR